MKKIRANVVWMALCVAIAGCASNEKGKPLTAEQNQAKSRLESQVQAAAKTKQTYHAMDNAALLTKLVEQSKAQKEPFNSPAYRELKGRTDIDSKTLVALVKDNGNASGLLPLLLLRKLDDKSYLELPAELRAKILTDALQGSAYFNVWGLPNFYLEDASHAMVEAGKNATPALKRMLSDTRPAPVFGSQEYMIYKQYRFRLCDYALFFLEQIGNNANFKMPVSPAERDALIKQLAGAK
ncbi:MAG: hypothetical protein WA853_11150 [Candidatus Acidiferrum sp.]